MTVRLHRRGSSVSATLLSRDLEWCISWLFESCTLLAWTRVVNGGAAVHLLDELSGGGRTVAATRRLYVDNAPLCIRSVYMVVEDGDG